MKVSDSCKHHPDWHSVSVQYNGDGCYVDVNCIRCGVSGCVGSHKTLAEAITWDNEDDPVIQQPERRGL